MRASTALAAPIFELRGAAARIDLGAWISGLSYAAGFALAGPAGIGVAAQNSSEVIPVLILGYATFLAAVLIIQRHMRLSLLACTFGSPQRLVTSGIFGYSRNPIYVAFFIPLASLAILSLSAAIAAIALYILAMNLTVIAKEERELSAAFGTEFGDYLASVPRWLI
jgi:protein-S-isoprenylcysteine O-methyltransferase Ste14